MHYVVLHWTPYYGAFLALRLLENISVIWKPDKATYCMKPLQPSVTEPQGFHVPPDSSTCSMYGRLYASPLPFFNSNLIEKNTCKTALYEQGLIYVNIQTEMA